MGLYDILMSDNVVDAINDNLDYILTLIPELKNTIGFDQKHPHHHLDVWNHTLLALSYSEKDYDIRLSLLLHDIGKPFSYQEIDGVRHYKNHGLVSSMMAKDILKRFFYNERYINKITYYIKNHDVPISQELIDNNYEDALMLLKIQKCDALAHHPDKLEKRKQYIKKMENKLYN